MKKYVSDFKSAGSIEMDGGKGYNLKVLTQSGFNVPPGVVVSSEFYKEYYDEPTAFSYHDALLLQQQCEEMQKRVKEKELPEDLITEIKKHFNENDLVAVRSSSTFEDLAGAAFAGQHDTYLNVGVADIQIRVKECFASLWNMNAVVYRHENGFSQVDASMAVVVQKMVPAESAGVAFSVDPIGGKFEHVLIEASKGLGETVVAGESLTDTWKVDMKNVKIVSTNLAGVEPSLTSFEVMQVARLAKKIENHYHSPQDIEWAIYNGEIYLLQSRPQTVVPAYFTRDESAERFPDPVSNLTWEFVEEAFNESLEYSLKLMGIDLPTRPWFAMKDGYVYGNENAVNILKMKRPLQLTKIEDLALLDTKYHWAEELARNWQVELHQYLLKLGELQHFPTENVKGYKKYFDQLFGAAKKYFMPNIAISMTQGFLVGTLHEALYFLYKDPVKANIELQKILSTAELKTAKVNNDLMKIENKSVGNPDFDSFLERYGHRELNFDYYHPTWADMPESLASMNAKTEVKEDKTEGILAIKKALELVPDEVYVHLYKLIQLAVKYTELDDEEHFQTTRINLYARRAAIKFGESLELDEPLDVFFMTKEEFDELNSGVKPELKEKLVSRRKSYHDLYQVSPKWVYSEQVEEMVLDKDTLTGVPGSAGSVTAPVYIIRSVDDFPKFPDGAILVTRTTNPAWTTLFYRASGLITESGGPLSHGAVTAREVGIPAVMSVRNVLSSLKNGEVVTIDGTTGVVKKKS